MKKITLLRIVIAITVLFSSITGFGQITPVITAQQPDLRNCGYNCTSNNFTVHRAYLIDADPLSPTYGEELSDSNATCTVGQPAKLVSIGIQYSSNQNGDVYGMRLFSSFNLGGVISEINPYIGTVQGKGSNYGGTGVVDPDDGQTYGVVTMENSFSFYWNCGDHIELTNIVSVWKTSQGQAPAEGDSYTCSSYSSSQCQNSAVILVQGPLAVQFDYTSCDTSATDISPVIVQFTSTTTGGNGIYTYNWNFNGGVPINGSSNTDANPTVQYANDQGNYNPTLIVTDGDGVTNLVPYTELLVFSPFLVNTPNSSAQTCSNGDGSGSFTGSGGTGTGTYSFNVDFNSTGATTSESGDALTFTGAGTGTIQVTITDEAGCTATESITFVAGDSIDPTITAPGNALLEGCDTSAIAGAGELAFSTTVVDITLAQLEAAFDTTGTAADNVGGSGIKRITYVDVASGACPIVVTRYYNVFDNCDNTPATVNHTITIQDSTAPSLTGSAYTDATVYESCSADAESTVPAWSESNAIAGYTDNCGAGVTASLTGTATTGDDCSWTVTYTYSVFDACNNELSSQTYSHSGGDSTAPIWTSTVNALNITLECSDASGIAAAQAAFPIASDNCDSDVTNLNKVSGSFVADVDCANSGTYTNTWTVTDNCGNTSETFTQVITLIDTTAPTWTSTVNALNITLECSDVSGIAAAQAVFPIASDNCDSDVSNLDKTSGVFVADVDCPNSGTYTNTWTVTDDCGNTSAIFTQIITIIDTTPPVLAGGTDDATESTGPDPSLNADYIAWRDNFAGVTATDNCGSATMSYVEGNWATSACGNEITVTFTGTDECGLTSSQDQTFTIVDSTPPVLIGGVDDAAECTGSDPSLNADYIAWRNNFGGVTSTDVFGNPTMSYTEGTWNSTGCTDTMIVTFTATDGCGLTTNKDLTFVISDTTDPSLTVPSDVTIECTEDTTSAATGIAIGSDICGNVNITESDSIVSNCGNTMVITRTWTATDECGNTTSADQIITVIDTTPPSITAPADVTIECTEDASSQSQGVAIGSDTCGNVAISESDVVVANCGTTMVITRTWTATDDCGNTTSADQIITVVDTTPPVLAGGADDATESTGPDPSLNAAYIAWRNNFAGVSATDNCGSATMSYVEGNWATAACGNEITVTFTATDDCGLTSSQDQTFMIVDSTPPVLIGGADDAAECTGSDPSLNAVYIAWRDNFGGVTSTDVFGNPTMSYVEGSWNSTGCTDTIIVTFTATDGCGLTTSTDLTFVISDTTAPSITIPADVTIECTEDASSQSQGMAIGDDTCGNVIISESDAEVANCGNTKIITRTWTATDECGNTTSADQTITIIDTVAPVISTEASNETVEADGEGNLQIFQNWIDTHGGAVATDNCSNVTWSHNYTDITYICGKSGSVDVMFTATDECGNATSTTATFNIVDTIAPVLTSIPPDITLECDEDLGTGAQGVAVFSDVNSDVEITYSDTFVSTRGAGGVLTRVWTATDKCGNVTQINQTITVEDTVPPTLTVPSDVTVECTEDTSSASTGVATATDNCDTIAVTESDAVVDTCGNTMIITRTWTATDNSGNAISGDQIITVVDTTPPSIVVPDDVTVECTEDYSSQATGMATGIDSCGNVTISESDATVDTCGNTMIITRTWTVTDECGNATSADQVITIEDTTPPSIVVPEDTTVECTEDYSSQATGMATGSDTCGNVVITESDSVEDTCGNTMIITRTWTATDDCGNATSASQVITIVDTTPPSITAPADVTVECTGDYSSQTTGVATGSDTCGDVTITESDSTVDACGSTMIITRTWTATDACGNMASATQTITLADTEGPTFNSMPANIEVTCAAEIPGDQGVTASDNCDVAPIVVFTQSAVPSCNGDVINTWTATDACGNETVYSQTVTINDTIAPVFTTDEFPTDIIVECDAVPTPLTMTAMDNCGGEIEVVLNEETIVPGTGCQNYTTTRVWSAMDCAGNEVTHTQVITVVDTTPPTIIEFPDTELTVNCSDIPSPAEIFAVDNCSSEITTSFEEQVLDVNDGGSYQIIRAWVLADECGNESSFVQTINVEPLQTVDAANIIDLCIDDLSLDLLTLLSSDIVATGVWSDDNNSGGLSGNSFDPANVALGVYEFTYRSNDTDCAYSEVFRINVNDDCVVLPCSTDDIAISRVLTPNGDGHNDVFEIGGLELCGYTYDVMIFNRWGAMVYQSANYQNNWSGYNNEGGMTIGSSATLPTGTYYYVVKVLGGNGGNNVDSSAFKPITGYIYLGSN